MRTFKGDVRVYHNEYRYDDKPPKPKFKPLPKIQDDYSLVSEIDELTQIQEEADVSESIA